MVKPIKAKYKSIFDKIKITFDKLHTSSANK